VDQPTSSFALLERIHAGDREAFDLLFTRYQRRLAVLIYYKLDARARGLTEVDDILQETLLRAFRSIDAFAYRTPGSFLQWLARIADNTIADTARYQTRARRQAVAMVPLRSESQPDGVEPADSETPSRILRNSEQLAALLERLDQLPDQYREAIVLAKIEGLSTAELAERLGKSREAASLLLHRAVARFRDLVEHAPK